jgi:flagellar biosynthesis/type III secretory pathway chaperone
MDASPEYNNLKIHLDEMVTFYRSLLDLIRLEKQLLISSDIEKLNLTNRDKEILLNKIKSADQVREKLASELANKIGLTTKPPRLLDLAKKHTGIFADQLRQIHSTLSLLIERVMEFNRENEKYALSALKSLNSALNEIKSTISGKKTYARKGQMEEGPHKSGNFVSKEA